MFIVKRHASLTLTLEYTPQAPTDPQTLADVEVSCSISNGDSVVAAFAVVKLPDLLHASLSIPSVNLPADTYLADIKLVYGSVVVYSDTFKVQIRPSITQ